MNHALVHTHWVGALGARRPTLELSEPCVLAGVEWTQPTRARIELRARSVHGGWSPWTLASVQGHDSDAGAGPAHACFGEPVWTGPGTVELEIRADRRVRDLSVHVVSEQILADQARAGAGAEVGVGATARAEAEAPRRVSPGLSRSASPGATPLAQPVLPAGPGQPPIVARRAWAGNRQPGAPPQYGHVAMMFVHHSVNANGYSAGQVPGMLLSIYEFHRYVRGWNDIGYNFAIDAFGRIWEARAGGIDQAVVGAQAGGYNMESSGVVMLGTFADVLPSAAALSALTRLLAWKLCLHGVPVSGEVVVEVDPPDAYYTAFRPGQRVTLPRIAGHRQGCTTDCPGNALFGHLPTVRAAVRRSVGASQLALILGLPAAPAVSAPTLLEPASEHLTAGQLVTLVGRLTRQSADGAAGRDAEPVAGATVEIESLSDEREGVAVGAAGPLDNVLSAADGSFSAQFTPVHNVLVRALHSAAPAVASPLVRLAVAPAITLTQTAGSVPPRFTGTVTPHKAKLTLEIRAAEGAHAIKAQQSVEVAADGSFGITPKRVKSGSYWVRVTSAADGANVAGLSPRLTVEF